LFVSFPFPPDIFPSPLSFPQLPLHHPEAPETSVNMTFLQDSYQRFLQKKKDAPAPLAANVSLIYVPTTTRIDGADAVKDHLSRHAKIVEKQSEQVINVIESSNALCLDIETTLRFTQGGGVYLPAMDDNFLADSVATIPTVNSPRSHYPSLSKSTIAY
jgi:hypothetical protein